MEDIFYKLWFHDLLLHNDLKSYILSTGITAKDFYHMVPYECYNIGLDFVKAMDLDKSKNLGKYESIVKYLYDNNIHYLTHDNKEFPEFLKLMPTPCIGLFARGNIPDLTESLAIVGARNASEYGRTVAFNVANQMSTLGICIVSGMAKGVDSSAHKGALQGNAPTIAIMGSGFKNIYPRENLDLYKRIVENGCVLTEYMPDSMPLPQNFPMRNRIISALSKAILVVEAGKRSGSLITASYAQSHGKEVFAVPGNIYNPKSIGTNKLISDGIKIFVETEDLIRMYPRLAAALDLVENKRFNKTIIQKQQTDDREIRVDNADQIAEKILSLLDNGAVSLDTITDELKTRIDLILAVLSNLECSGLIKRAYGKYYLSV